MNIKLGCGVKIVDGSYMVRVDDPLNGGPRGNDGKVVGSNKDIWEVIEINKPFPTRSSSVKGVLSPTNNCLIQNTITGEEWYCSGINIKFYADAGDFKTFNRSFNLDRFKKQYKREGDILQQAIAWKAVSALLKEKGLNFNNPYLSALEATIQFLEKNLK